MTIPLVLVPWRRPSDAPFPPLHLVAVQSPSLSLLFLSSFLLSVALSLPSFLFVVLVVAFLACSSSCLFCCLVGCAGRWLGLLRWLWLVGLCLLSLVVSCCFLDLAWYLVALAG